MTVWIVFAAMIAVAVGGALWPLLRPGKPEVSAAPAENAVLARQLAEIDAQFAAGSLPAEAAQSLKTETLRRFLAEGPAAEPAARPLGRRSVLPLALSLGAVVASGGVALYTSLGRPDLATVSASPAPQAAADAASESGLFRITAALEAKMRQQPGDPEGWRLLGEAYTQAGRFDAAAAAFGRASGLDPANADDASARGEALVRADKDGRVTPDAKAAFLAAVALNPADPRARYFLAAAKDEAGDHAGAMADWIALLKSAPPGAPWADEVRGYVIKIAAARGEDVSARLPPLLPAPAATPKESEAAAVQALPPAAQQAMIRTMVDRLAARLKANPKDDSGWITLMRARMVMGDAAGASGAYRDARQAFAGDPARQSSLAEAGRQLKVPGA